MYLKQVFIGLSIIATVVVSSSSPPQQHRILVVAPHGTKSHHNMIVPLVKELAARGHQLTVISNYVANDLQKRENVRDIVMDQLAIDMSQYPNVFDMITTPGSFTKYLNYIQVIVGAMLKTAPHTAQETFSDPRIKDLIDNDRFDLLMISEACPLIGYAMAWHFKTPFIMLSPNVLFPGRASSLGDGEQYSYAPFLFTRFSDRMTFTQRMINMIAANAFDWVHTRMHEPAIRSIIRQQVIPDCPPLYDIEKNISLVFTNTHPSFTYPRALPPQVIEVGGIHCRPAKPLPADLESFVSSSSNSDNESSDAGFIIFAIGSAMKMDDMPEEMMQSFIKAFSRLSQKVVWQWKGKPRSDLPSNVLAIPWLPQQDLLGN
jgi:glucuronosyltransferase